MKDFLSKKVAFKKSANDKNRQNNQVSKELNYVDKYFKNSKHFT